MRFGTPEKPLPSNFVEYDHLDPSPHFTKQQIDYIESIRDDFNAEDLARIRDIEWFMLNLNVEGMAEGVIPGLRTKPGIGCLYIRRYSTEKYTKMIDAFLDYIPKDFPKEHVLKCYMPSYRVTLPTGDQFYPIVFHGDLNAWRKRLEESAYVHHTLTGHFDHGKFVVSDGRRFDFSAIKVDKVKSEPIPKAW